MRAPSLEKLQQAVDELALWRHELRNKGTKKVDSMVVEQLQQHLKLAQDMEDTSGRVSFEWSKRLTHVAKQVGTLNLAEDKDMFKGILDDIQTFNSAVHVRSITEDVFTAIDGISATVNSEDLKNINTATSRIVIRTLFSDTKKTDAIYKGSQACFATMLMELGKFDRHGEDEAQALASHISKLFGTGRHLLSFVEDQENGRHRLYRRAYDHFQNVVEMMSPLLLLTEQDGALMDDTADLWQRLDGALQNYEAPCDSDRRSRYSRRS